MQCGNQVLRQEVTLETNLQTSGFLPDNGSKLNLNYQNILYK